MQPSKQNEEISDTELLQSIARHRDRIALSTLYTRYSHSLGGFLSRKLGDQKLVDEVYNEVMFTVWEKADTFRNESKASTWIYGIAFRVSMNHRRKESRHTERIDEYELDELPQAKPSNSENEEKLESLNRAMRRLSDEHRHVTELAYYMGNSIAEIADIIDCPINTVKTRLYHARLQLIKHVNFALNAP